MKEATSQNAQYQWHVYCTLSYKLNVDFKQKVSLIMTII